MKTKVSRGTPTFVISSDLSFILCCKGLNTSFLSENLMMTFFGLAFDFKRWEAWIFARSTGVSHSMKIFKMQSFNSTSWIDSRIPEISRYLCREYYSFSQHFFSTKTSCWMSLLLTFWLIVRSDSSWWKFVFSCFSSSLTAR